MGSYIAYEISFTKITHDSFTDYRNTARSSVALKKIESDLLVMEVKAKEFIRSYDKNYLDDFYIYHEKILKSIEDIKTLNGAIKPYLSDISTLEKLLKNYVENFESVSSVESKEKNISTLIALETQMNSLLEKLSKVMIAKQDTIGPKIVKQNDVSLQRTVVFSIFVIFLFVVVSLLFMWDFFKKISVFQSGLFQFFDFLKDSEQKPEQIKVFGKDEISKMAKVVNESIDTITKIIQQRDQANKINLEILNAQASIVLLTNGEKVVKANRTFLNFFNVENIEKFTQEHECICDFFEYEEGKGYIQRDMDGVNWADYIAENTHEYHKVKMKNKVFHVNVTKFKLLDIEKYVVVFDDMTKEIESQKKLKENLKQIEILNKKLKEQAILDPLTKILNRRGIQEHFGDLFESSKRDALPISLIMFDIDFFKKVNDTYGHEKGDDVLVDISSALKKVSRQSDLYGRFGGEEFIVIMPQSDSDEALCGAERLREYIEKNKLGGINITISCGVYTEVPTNKDSSKELLEKMLIKADTALYKAKQTGRNKVVVSK
jgi:diguanylate cyclase (GGDEF)-like protein